MGVSLTRTHVDRWQLHIYIYVCAVCARESSRDYSRVAVDGILLLLLAIVKLVENLLMFVPARSTLWPHLLSEDATSDLRLGGTDAVTRYVHFRMTAALYWNNLSS